MNRILWLLIALLTLAPTATATAASAAASAAVAAPDESIPPTTTVDTRPPITANEFLPEDRDLTSCIGALERPGCGSESRGGWRQTLILVAIVVGLAVVFGNIARGVRRNQRARS